MYIVYVFGKKHSAWNTKKEAQKQSSILKNYGYKKIHIEYDETVYCDNGYYYI